MQNSHKIHTPTSGGSEMNSAEQAAQGWKGVLFLIGKQGSEGYPMTGDLFPP